MRATFIALFFVARLTLADSIRLIGFGRSGDQAVAYLYFPDSSYGMKLREGQERIGVTLVRMDPAAGVARVRRDGHEDMIYLGHGVEPAPAAVESIRTLTRNQNKNLEEQIRKDREAVLYAEQLSTPDPEALRRTYELSLQRRQRLAQESQNGGLNTPERRPALIEAPAADVDAPDALPK